MVTTNTRNGLNLDILEGTLENYWRDITEGATKMPDRWAR